jgi:hypothetical protein
VGEKSGFESRKLLATVVGLRAIRTAAEARRHALRVKAEIDRVSRVLAADARRDR